MIQRGSCPCKKGQAQGIGLETEEELLLDTDQKESPMPSLEAGALFSNHGEPRPWPPMLHKGHILAEGKADLFL